MTKQQQADLIVLCNLVKESADRIKTYSTLGVEDNALREIGYLERTVENVKKCFNNGDGIHEASIDFIRRKV